jgi:hypothetical protein
MTYVKARKSELSVVSLLVAIAVTAGSGADAATGHRSHVAHAHGSHPQGQNVQSASIRESTRPAGMRYYGGPKSPMWSGQ